MAMQAPLLSVVVPIYNSEKYLRRCLGSILTQSFQQLEVICVNDGSTDGSQGILEEYAAHDERIRILEKTNGGLVSARKAGVIEACGEYIGFVDSDDWIETEMFARLYEEARIHNADCVSSGYVQEGNFVSYAYDSVPSGVYQGDRMRELYGSMIMDTVTCGQGVRGSLCTKLFRSSILKAILPKVPDSLTVAEDKMTTIWFLLHSETVSVLNEAYYHYVLRASSMTHEGNAQYLLRINDVYLFFQELYRHENFSHAMRVQSELYMTQLLIHGINVRLGFSIRNLLWIDPCWMSSLPKGSRVAIYGVGDLGRKYHQQIMASEKIEFAGCVDFEQEGAVGYPFEIWSPEKLLTQSYDVLVITVKDSSAANKIKERLVSVGIEEGSMRWFEQKEIFWKFAQADGLVG